MSSEFEKYQNTKQTILLVAWKQIEQARDAKTNRSAITRDLNQLFELLNYSHPKITSLLDEIVESDKWIKYYKDYSGKINRAQFVMLPKGRLEIDTLMKTKAEKLISWLNQITPKVAKYIDETIIRPAIQIGLGQIIAK